MKHKLLFILIISLLVGCKSQQNTTTEHTKNVHSEQKDSTIYREKLEVKVKPVPADTTKLKLNPADIAALPSGASFNQKSGRAGINVKQSDDGNIEITATCDSLNVLYESLLREYEHFQTLANDSIDTLNKEIVIVKSQSIWDGFFKEIGKLVAIIIGVLIVIFLIKKK